MRRLISAALLAAAVTACAKSPAPAGKSDTVSYQLRDHTGTPVTHSAPRTEPQPVIYTTHHVHPPGTSNPVADRAAAVFLGAVTLGVAADPESSPPKKAAP